MRQTIVHLGNLHLSVRSHHEGDCMPSAEDVNALRDMLENRRAEVVALRRLVLRAADQLEELTETDCPEPVIHKVKQQAEVLRKIATKGRYPVYYPTR